MTKYRNVNIKNDLEPYLYLVVEQNYSFVGQNKQTMIDGIQLEVYNCL